MSKHVSFNTGFTLVELIAVMALIGIIGATVGSSFLPSDTFQLQSSRDQVITAFLSAQQRAMSQTNAVRVTISSPNQLDIREDSDGDGSYSDESSLRLGGKQYPLTLQSNQTLTATTFDFDRLGRTTASVLSLTQNSQTVTITVTDTGYID